MVILDYWIQTPLIVGGSLVLLIYINYSLLKDSVRLRKLGHAKYFKQPAFILEPTQQHIYEGKIPIPKAIWALWGIQLVVALLSSFLLQEIGTITTNRLDVSSYEFWMVFICEGVLGFILSRYIQSILGSKRNIDIFKFIIENPSILKGELILSKEYLFTATRIELKLSIAVWFVILIFTGRPFFAGGIITLLWRQMKTYNWEKTNNHKKPVKTEN